MDRRRSPFVVVLALVLAVLALPGIAYAVSAADGFNPDTNNAIWSIATQPDSKVLTGGGFTTIGGVTINNIARLNTDCSVDTGFNPNTQ